MRWIVPLAIAAGLLAGCGSVGSFFAPEASRGLATELDDITAGLDDNASRGFFDDGVGVDHRGRPENSDGVPMLSDLPVLGGLFRGPGDTVAPGESASAPPVDRKMIYRGQVAVEVARVEAAVERFVNAVVARGGYLSQRKDNSITCRVPAVHFEDTVAEVKGYGRVLAESMQADDVTKQHLDVTIRLENARRARDRLLAILEKAEKVEDILKVEEQLRRLTEEIERFEGELKFLNDQVAMSTVTAAFHAVAEVGPQQRRPSRFGWINMVGVEYVSRRF